MNTFTIVLLVILVVLIAALVALYFFGKKAQKKQEEQQAQIEAAKQTVSMLVIDKKRLRLKESGDKRFIHRRCTWYPRSSGHTAGQEKRIFQKNVQQKRKISRKK